MEQSLVIQAAWRTDVGKVRRNNEDSVALDETGRNPWWGVVCDGLGGAAAGEVASRMAADLFADQLSRLALADLNAEHLNHLVAAINAAVYGDSMSNLDHHTMGTTLSGLVIDTAAWRYWTVQVGDSRIYLLRDGNLLQLTRDHNLGEDLLQQHLIDRIAFFRFFRSATGLTRCIGMTDFPGADVHLHECRIGDRWLICSDGLTNYLEENLIRQLLGDRPVAAAADALVETTLERGAPDNVTVVVAEAR